jgi:hypothetical protein
LGYNYIFFFIVLHEVWCRKIINIFLNDYSIFPCTL